MPIAGFRRFVRRNARKAKSWSTIVALTLSGNKIEKKSTLHKSKNPVLLIYGFGATRRTFSILEKRLHNDGYTVFSINLGGIFGTFNTHGVQDLAAMIDEKIERLYKKYDFRGRISIIAHSKGGLIGRYYVKRLGGDRRVKTLITLGTPHNGSPWALLAAITPVAVVCKSVRQMTPMSAFIRRLKQGPFPKRTKLYSIYSKDDRVCVYPGAVLDEAGNVKNVEVDGISHSEFLIKKTIYHIIQHALQDQLPVSLELRSREKHQQHLAGSKTSAPLKLIQGAKSLAMKKIS